MTPDTVARFADRRFAWLGEPLPEIMVSFEFFPPKSETAAAQLWQTAERLKPLRPGFVSVTCGAGGNPAAGTVAWVDALRREAELDAVAHITCASAPRETIDQLARQYWAAGVRHVLALRGDRPKEQPSWPDGESYRFAAELVAALRRIADFQISVAAYPETHPEAESAEADLDNLKRKLDAGASRAITQYCFDTETVLRFRDRMSAAGIRVPLGVGILPVRDFVQARRFSERCGASVPDWLGALFDGLEGDAEQQALLGASIAAEQARRLIVEDITHLHFYTLNRAKLTIAACRLLGFRPAVACAAAA
ncbi:MAG: methylenetetrahydrofolate reductase [NAD(P)H] [Geminicoccaceae bacterium]